MNTNTNNNKKEKINPPIISMRRMSMNESVAATCCYKTIKTDNGNFVNVLTGGWVGPMTSVTQTKSENYPAVPVWLTIKGDYSTAQTAFPIQLVNGAPNYVTVDGDGNPVLNPLSQVASFLGGGATCDHSDSNCAYYTWSVDVVDETHADATVSHAVPGGNWREPHPAYQFTS